MDLKHSSTRRVVVTNSKVLRHNFGTWVTSQYDLRGMNPSITQEEMQCLLHHWCWRPTHQSYVCILLATRGLGTNVRCLHQGPWYPCYATAQPSTYKQHLISTLRPTVRKISNAIDRKVVRKSDLPLPSDQPTNPLGDMSEGIEHTIILEGGAPEALVGFTSLGL